MPEGDVRIFGADTHVPRKTFPWLLGGAAIVTVLALRSRPSSSGGPSVSSTVAGNVAQQSADALEFQKLQLQASTELSQLMASNRLEMQAQEHSFELAKANAPGAGKSCIPHQKWLFLDKETQRSLRSRVAAGQLIESVGPDGICFTPTTAGMAGYMPYTKTTSKSGLFGGSYSTTAPVTAGMAAAQMTAPTPSIFSFLESIIRIFNQPVF